MKIGSTLTQELEDTEKVSQARRNLQILDAGLALRNYAHMTAMKKNDLGTRTEASGLSAVRDDVRDDAERHSPTTAARSFDQNVQKSNSTAATAETARSDSMTGSKLEALIRAIRSHDLFATSPGTDRDEQTSGRDKESAMENTSQPSASTTSQSASASDHVMPSASTHSSSQTDDDRSQILMSLLRGGVRPADAERIYAIYLREANGATPPALPPRSD